MTHKDFNDLRERILTEAERVMDEKGKDYHRDDDVLYQLKTIAGRTGLTVRQVWAVFFFKQVAPIERWVRGEEPDSESLQSRITDSINFLLMAAAIDEHYPTAPGRAGTGQLRLWESRSSSSPYWGPF